MRKREGSSPSPRTIFNSKNISKLKQASALEKAKEGLERDCPAAANMPVACLRGEARTMRDSRVGAAAGARGREAPEREAVESLSSHHLRSPKNT